MTSVHNADVAVVTSEGITLTWEDLYHRYAPSLIAYARSRGATAPEDLVQDVLVTAVERLSRFEGDVGGLASYLFTITYRRVADEHRRRFRSRESLVSDHDSLVDGGDGPDEIVATKETVSDALRAFEILTERERSVLEMRILEEATPDEVGSALGLSNGNVRVIQARALAKVRRFLSTNDRGRPLASAGMAWTFLRSLRSSAPLTAWADWTASAKSAGLGVPAVEAGGVSFVVGLGWATAHAGLAVAVAAVASIGVIANSSEVDRRSMPIMETVPPSAADVGPVTARMALDIPRAAPREPDVEETAQRQPTNRDDPPPTANEGGGPVQTAGMPAAGASDVQTFEESPPAPAPVTTSLELVEPIIGAVDTVVDAVVGEIVESVVATVVQDVVTSGLETAADEVVEPVVETVGEQVLEPVLDETVETLTDVVTGDDIAGLLPD